ncbi:hypothetical protein [Microbulbifer sp. TYP-18]|uniref:hypothetical protein n=1 Tax=Microbulbifer sp. TYP-18 TaxID=3230024 RepID=UPI0034C66EE9
MNLENKATFLLGLGLLVYFISSAFKGEIVGAGASGLTRSITPIESPIHFWFSVSLGVVVGGLLIMGAWERRSGRKNKKPRNPFDKDIR